MQRPGLHRDAQHGQARHGGRHARKVRSAARARDDDLETFALGALGERIKPIWCAVGRNDAGLVGDAERIERLG